MVGKVVDRHEEPLASVYEAEDVLEQCENFFVRNECVSNLGPWCGLSSRVNRGMKPWTGVVESGASQRFTKRIRSHTRLQNNAPWMGPQLRRKLVMIFGSGIEQESSK